MSAALDPQRRAHIDPPSLLPRRPTLDHVVVCDSSGYVTEAMSRRAAETLVRKLADGGPCREAHRIVLATEAPEGK